MSSYTNSYSSATTVIGYTFNADTYCRFCAVTLFDTNDVDTVGAIFNGSEWDYVPTCGACGETIDGVTVLTLTRSLHGSRLLSLANDTKPASMAMAMSCVYKTMATTPLVSVVSV